MIQTSQEFKNAVKNGKPQCAWLRFEGVLFTNEDIDLTSGGITFTERFNESTDLRMGAAPSSSINAQLFNDDGLLNDYEFGNLEASLGAMVSSSSYTPSGNVTASYSGMKVFTGHDTRPYLRENGAACSMQPSFPVKSILIEDNVVYCFGEGSSDFFAFSVGNDTWGGVSRFTWNYMSGYEWDNMPKDYIELASNTRAVYGKVGKFDLNPFMRNKFNRFVAERRGISKQGDTLREYFPDGTVRTYEMVKLGTFVVPRPAIVRKRVIDMEANDQMVLFDEMWFEDIGINFPITVVDLLERICAEVGVKCITRSFIGDGTLIKEKPDAFDNATLREILAWIAEAACSYARFNRDGKLELTWFNQTSRRFDEHDYSEFVPISYEVSRVDQLHIRNANSEAELIVGGGDNAYLIQDNPLLREDDTDIVQEKYKVEKEENETTAEDQPVAPQAISTLAARKNPLIPIAFATYAANNAIEDTTSPKSIIYDRLASFPEFNPSSASLFSDWSVQAGDIVSVSFDGDAYSVPVYSSTLYWNGGAKLDIESTGNETRDPLSKYDRQQFASGRGGYGSQNALDALKTWAIIERDEINGKITLSAGKIEDLEGRVSQAEIDIDGANADILLWAKRTERNEELISQAFIDIDGANAQIALHASRLDKAEDRLSQAEIRIDGAEADILLWAKRVENNEQLISQAFIDIDGANARIDLHASRLDKAEDRLSQAEINIDGAEAKISLWAERVERNEELISQARIDIDGANARIDLEASRIDKAEGRLSEAEIEINGAEGRIGLKTIVANLNDDLTGLDRDYQSLSKLVNEVGEDVKTAFIEIDAERARITEYAGRTSMLETEYGDIEKRMSSAELVIDGDAATIGLKTMVNTLTVKTDSIESRVSKAEIDINGDAGTIGLKTMVDDMKATEAGLEKRLSSAEIDINGGAGTIGLKTRVESNEKALNGSGTETGLISKVTTAVADINAAKAAIALKADTTTVDALRTRVSSAELILNGGTNPSAGLVSKVANVEKTSDDAFESSAQLWTWVANNGPRIEAKVDKDGVIAAINLSVEEEGGSRIKIKADQVNLSGYVTASQLEVTNATITNLMAGRETATSIVTNSIGINSHLTIYSHQADWYSRSFGTSLTAADTRVVQRENITYLDGDGNKKSLSVVTGITNLNSNPTLNTTTYRFLGYSN